MVEPCSGPCSGHSPTPVRLAGFVVVPAAFTLVGFNWGEAYRLLVTRYYQGAGGIPPFAHWEWENLACTVPVVGPATVAALRRACPAPVRKGFHR